MTTDEWVKWIQLWAGDRLRGWRSAEAGYLQYRRRLVEKALVPRTKILEAAMVMISANAPSSPDKNEAFAALRNAWDKEVRQPTYLYDRKAGEALSDEARRGDEEADAAMSEIASKQLGEMPPSLAKHVKAVLRRSFETPPKRGRGGDRHSNVARNLFIIDALTALQEARIHPTQNRESRTKGNSGSAIVAKALAGIGIHIDATGVEKVWAQRSRYVRR